MDPSVSLTVLVTLWNPLAAGAPVMATEFASGLRGAGHRVIVAHGPRPTDSTAPDVLDRLRETGAELVALPRFTVRDEWTNVRRCVGIARQENVDAVMSFQQRDRLLGAAVARRAGVPFVVHCGLAPLSLGGRLARRPKSWLQGRVLRSADLVLCPSPVVHDAVVDEFGVSPERAPVLFNGVDTARTAAVAAAAREKEPPPHDPLRLSSVGRTQWEKGHDIALEALDALTDVSAWHLSIFGQRTGGGSDDHDRRIADLLASPALASRVSLPGWSSDVAAELGRTDVYVHPSRTEGWSLAVCEALAAGCPTVFSDCAGRPPGFVDGTHGWIVPTGDVGALRDTLRTVLTLDAEERAAVGRAGSVYAAEHFDIGRCQAQMVTWIETLAGPEGPRAQRSSG